MGEDGYPVGGEGHSLHPNLEQIRDDSAEAAAADLMHTKRLHHHYQQQQEHQLREVARGSHQPWGNQRTSRTLPGQRKHPAPSNEGSQRKT